MKERKSLCLTLAALMAVTAAGGVPVKAEESKERVPIRWMTTGDSGANALVENDRIVEEINNRLGVDLEVVIVPQDGAQKINVAMASGDLPDIVTGEFGTSATQQWMDDGLVIPLNDYFDANPDIKKWCEEYSWNAAEDGSHYGIPFITQYDVANTLVLMRQDWLDNLGLKYPENLEEMKEVLIAFTKNDPDGNGKDDTYGYSSTKMTSSTSTPYDWVFFAYGLPYADFSLDENDNVIPWFEDPSFEKGMNYIVDLWNEGVIDPEFMLNDMAKEEEKFYQGKVGAEPLPLFRNLGRYEANLAEMFPEATAVYGKSPAGPDGDYGLSRQGKNGMITFITDDCENPDKAAEFLNFMISEEGNDLVRLGIEGIHYTKDGDKIVFNEEEREKDGFSGNGWCHPLAWGVFYWPLESGYIPETDPVRERALDSVKVASECQKKNLINRKMKSEIENGSIVGDVFVQYFSDMLQGNISVEEGVVQLSKSWRSQGGDAILEEANEIYHASK